MKQFILNKWVEEMLQDTLQAEESLGYLLYFKGKNTPSGLNEGLFPIITANGRAGRVRQDPRVVKAVYQTISQMEHVRALEFQERSVAGDIPINIEKMKADPKYQILLVRPESYTFVSANPKSGYVTDKRAWSSAPKRTSLDDHLESISMCRKQMAYTLRDAVREVVDEMFCKTDFEKFGVKQGAKQ